METPVFTLPADEDTKKLSMNCYEQMQARRLKMWYVNILALNAIKSLSRMKLNR